MNRLKLVGGLVGAVSALLLAVTLLALAGPATAKQPVKFINPERYHCTTETTSDFGKVSATRELDGNGALVASSAYWAYPGGTMGSWIMAGWQVDKDDPRLFSRGYFQGRVDVGTHSAPSIPRSSRLRMEITTRIGGDFAGRPEGGFVGKYARWEEFSTSTMGVFANWDDLYAMSQGSDKLYIVARDRKGRTLRHYELSSSILRRAREEAGRLALEVLQQSRHHAEACLHEEANNDMVI